MDKYLYIFTPVRDDFLKKLKRVARLDYNGYSFKS